LGTRSATVSTTKGRKFDASGSVRDFGGPPTNKSAFNAEAKVFGDEYAKFEPVPGATSIRR